MKHERIHGSGEPGVCVLHGGPGAPDSAARLARILGRRHQVLEPERLEPSLAAQVQGLRSDLAAWTDSSVVLVGHSWGAMLGLAFAAKHPGMVSRLVMVGCGALEARHAKGIMDLRLARLDPDQRAEVLELQQRLADPQERDKDGVMARLGTLMAVADAFDMLEAETRPGRCRFDVFQAVWSGAEALRRQGRFLDYARAVRCPVLALHGDYDPHPARGIQETLTEHVRDIRFILLENCGHTPWNERLARESFLRLLFEELEKDHPIV